MMLINGQVLETPEAEKPFRVVISQGDEVLFEQPACTREEGQTQMLQVLKDMQRRIREKGEK